MIVATSAGPVRGRDGAFLGIPYGRAERFARPEPVPGWTDTRDALAFGPSCPQPTSPPGIDWACARSFPESEDCLTLNLWTPGTGGRRPVLVWLHGGGLHAGTASQPLYDGAALSRWGDVVVVSVNHRLHAFGFAGGNQGLLDLARALAWVRDNAEAFGGDPGNVTIFGQSGGGSKVVLLLALPAARGLFHRAIAQSGTMLRTGERADPAEADRRFAAELDRTGDVLAAAEAVMATMGVMAFGPRLDDDLPEEPVDVLRRGTVPFLVGATAGEYLAAGARMPLPDDAALRVALGQFLGTAAERHLAEGRARHPDASPGELFGRIFTEWSQDACWATAEAAGAWTYLFDHGGSPHGSELPLVFRSTEPFPGEPPAPPALVDEVSGAWVRFARTGDPGWPRPERHHFRG